MSTIKENNLFLRTNVDRHIWRVQLSKIYQIMRRVGYHTSLARHIFFFLSPITKPRYSSGLFLMSHPVYTWYNAYVHVTVNDTETQPSKRLRVVFRTSGKKGRRETILRYRLYSVSWFQDFYPRFCFTISSDTRASPTFFTDVHRTRLPILCLPPPRNLYTGCSLWEEGWIINRTNGEVIARFCSTFSFFFLGQNYFLTFGRD